MTKKITLRQCVGCGEMKDKRQLIRVVKDNEGHFSLDATGRAGGRGAYVCKTRECLENAFRKKGLERSFKAPVPEEVYRELEGEMNRLAE